MVNKIYLQVDGPLEMSVLAVQLVSDVVFLIDDVQNEIGVVRKSSGEDNDFIVFSHLFKKGFSKGPHEKLTSTFLELRA
jgi:hypothetical protein